MRGRGTAPALTSSTVHSSRFFTDNFELSTDNCQRQGRSLLIRRGPWCVGLKLFRPTCRSGFPGIHSRDRRCSHYKPPPSNSDADHPEHAKQEKLPKAETVPNGVNLGRMRTRRRVTLEQERRSENGDWQPICGVFGANSMPVTRFRGPRANRLTSRHS